MNNRSWILWWFTFLCFASCSSKKEKIRVAIQPFEPLNTQITDSLKSAVEKYYGFTVHVLPEIALPKKSYVAIKTPRYRADQLIVFLKATKPDSIHYILGLTDKDISITKYDEKGNVKKPIEKYRDFGVFGLGFRPGNSCIVSSYRLNDKHKEFFSRIKKVTLHELGHNLGLEHCLEKNCFMRSAAERIETVDQVSLDLCAACRKRIEQFRP